MAEPKSNPAQLDPSLAAMDPSIRRMKVAGAEEVLSGLARIGRGQPAPPRPDYTAERTRLIGMLGQLTELETAAQTDAAKTARAQFALQGTLLSTIGKIEAAKLGAQGTTLAARIKFYEERDKQLSEEVLRAGPRTMADLGQAPRTSIGKLSGYIKDKGVKSGREVAFAQEVLGTISELRADPRLVKVYQDEIKKEYGVDIGSWFVGKTGDASLGPVAGEVVPILQRGMQAQAEAAKVITRAEEERAKIALQILETPGISPGSALARAVNQYAEGVGLDLKTREVPGLPVKAGEAGPAPTEGVGVPVGGAAAATTTEVRTTGLRPYLQEQRDLILKELDRLENATDPESVRLRKGVMASPALAQWAAENGYADYRPDQQFKAAMAYRRKALKEQNAAFSAQLESDILAGEAGTPLGRAGVEVKQFLTGERAERDRMIEAGLAEARRRRAAREGEAAPAPAPGADSAELVGGAAGPADKAPGVPESEPTLAERPKEVIEAAMAEEPTISFDEGERFEERGKAPTTTAGISVGTARARNEIRVGAYTAQKQGADPEIVKAYEDAQAYKKSDPMKYAATLQELADKITARPPTAQVTGVGDQGYLARDWRAQRRPTVEKPEPEPMPSPEAAPVAAPLPSTEQPETPETEEMQMPEGEQADGVGAYEMSPEDEAFLTKLGAPAPGPESLAAPAGAPSVPAVAESAQPVDAAQLSGGLAGAGAAAKQLPQFQSFGAEAATTAAGESLARYQQMVEEDTRKRRAAMLRGTTAQ